MARLRRFLPTGVAEICQDRLGRTVVLTHERWAHILEHRIMDGHQLAVKTAVETARIRHQGKGFGDEVLYAENLGPAAWLAVVVRYKGSRGEIRTAYPKAKGPPPSGVQL